MPADNGFGVFAAMPPTSPPPGGVIPLADCGPGGFDVGDGAVAIARAGAYLALLTVRAPGGAGAEAAFWLWLDGAALIRDAGTGCRSSLAMFEVRGRARLSLRFGDGPAPAKARPRTLITLALVRLDAGPAQAAQNPLPEARNPAGSVDF